MKSLYSRTNLCALISNVAEVMSVHKLLFGTNSSVYMGVLGVNRGVPLYTEVSLFQGVGI